MDIKKALADLETKHAKSSVELASRVDAATKDVRAAEGMLRDAKIKLGQLQRDKVNESFAYDAERARVEKSAVPKAA